MAGYKCRGCGLTFDRKSDLSRTSKLCGVCVAFRHAREVIRQSFPGTEEWHRQKAYGHAGTNTANPYDLDTN